MPLTYDLPIELFEQSFGKLPQGAASVVAPGRTELAGNHTDHEGGHVIAAAVDRAVVAVAAPNGTRFIRLQSEGYPLVEVDLSMLEARPEERGTSASLVRGVAAQLVSRGFEPMGLDVAMTSSVAAGSGLSSSAAFELAVGRVLDGFWAKGAIDAAELAMMAQRSEREWFGKPCGLMDQAASALGGVQHMDFSVPGTLAAQAIDFDFAAAGHTVCLVDVGADHAANTDDYAAVPAEMQAVAAQLGAEILSQVSEADVISALPRIRTALGDRASLRALHYFREERLVAERAEALRAGDIDRFLELTRLSGASSAMYLQNVSVGGASDQPSMLAIALAEELLAGHGAVRVHGGGFGGTIQAFVPHEMVAMFAAGMDAVFGEGACGTYVVDHEGARFSWL